MNWLQASPVVLIVAIVGVVVVGIVLAIRHEKKRREAMRAFAGSNGFTF